MPRLAIWLLVLLLAVAVGAVDVATGRELTLSAIYVAVVVIAAWFLGLRGAVITSGLCALVGLVADHLLSEPYLQLGATFSNEAVPWANAGNRLVVFVFVGYVIARQRETVRAKQDLINRLELANREIETLEGLLPVCAWCKRIRDDGRWEPLEAYVAHRTKAEFTHGICPDCAARLRSEGAGEP